jgi:hypothetical protein
MTNAEGLADVFYACGPDAKIDLWVLPPYPKEQCGALSPLIYSDISTAGVVSDPTADGGIRCPRKTSKKLTPVPGQVVIFVKKPTWYQSHLAG